jgi:hypothetical protein
MSDEKITKISELNDALRAGTGSGRVMITAGVVAKGDAFVARATKAVQEFKDFTEGDDPYGEHDFGAFDLDGEKLFWKIDYYDQNMENGSEDPANPAVTTRVLTILLASEY